MSAALRQHDQALKDRRRLAGFSLVCAISVGVLVWWYASAGATPTVIEAANSPAQNSAEIGTPKASTPIAPAPKDLPTGWRYLQETPVPVATAGAPELPASAEDSRGETVEISDISRVIVGGDDTLEIMDSLGLTGSIHAAPEDTLIQSGRDAEKHFMFNKDTGPEGILAIEASLFFGNSIRRHTQVVEALAPTNLPAIIVEQNQQPVPKIKLTARLLGRSAAGSELADQVQAQLDEAKQIASASKTKLRVMNIATGGGGRPTVAGNETPPNDVINAAGGINAAADAGLRLYADISNEGIIASKPDVILVTVSDLATWGGPEKIWETWPVLKTTPAGRANRVIVMPDPQLAGGSVSAGAGTLDLAKALSEIGGQ